jgi:hypothetical protein
MTKPTTNCSIEPILTIIKEVVEIRRKNEEHRQCRQTPMGTSRIPAACRQNGTFVCIKLQARMTTFSSHNNTLYCNSLRATGWACGNKA